jgi:hypothetical protein
MAFHGGGQAGRSVGHSVGHSGEGRSSPGSSLWHVGEEMAHGGGPRETAHGNEAGGLERPTAPRRNEVEEEEECVHCSLLCQETPRRTAGLDQYRWAPPSWGGPGKRGTPHGESPAGWGRPVGEARKKSHHSLRQAGSCLAGALAHGLGEGTNLHHHG